MWLITGLIFGAALLGLVIWMRSKNISLTWYEWLIGAIGLLLLFWTTELVTGSAGAVGEPASGIWLFLLLMGLPALILLVIAWRLAARRQRAGS